MRSNYSCPPRSSSTAPSSTCEGTMFCINKNLTRLTNGQSNDLVNFCEATSTCTNTQLQNISGNKTTSLTYFTPAIAAYLRSLPGYAATGDIVLSLSTNVLGWTVGGGGSGTNDTFSALSGTAWDITTGTKKTKTLTSNTAITISNLIPGQSVALLFVTQDATGSRTLSINGTTITITTAANGTTLIGIIDVGGGFLAFDTNIGGGGSGALLTDITFPTNTTLLNTSGVWSGTGAASQFVNVGLSNLHLPAGIDGYVQTLGDVAANNAYFGFMTANTLPSTVSGASSFICGFAISGGDIYKADNGGTSGVPVGSYIPGIDLIRVSRVSGTSVIQVSTDNGVTWGSALYTFSQVNNGNYYIGTNIYGNNQGKLYNPKGLHIS
jgi:hypothetical protein